MSCFLVDNLESLVYRLRKDLAAFLGLELPSLLPLSVEEEEKKERRKKRRKIMKEKRKMMEKRT